MDQWKLTCFLFDHDQLRSTNPIVWPALVFEAGISGCVGEALSTFPLSGSGIKLMISEAKLHAAWGEQCMTENFNFYIHKCTFNNRKLFGNWQFVLQCHNMYSSKVISQCNLHYHQIQNILSLWKLISCTFVSPTNAAQFTNWRTNRNECG